MSMTGDISKHNFRAFLWHSGFLAFARNFMDMDTVLPAVATEAGGKPLHIGIIPVIMMGGLSFKQLLFAPMITHYPFKKKFLRTGANLRIWSLFALALILCVLSTNYFSNVLRYLLLFAGAGNMCPVLFPLFAVVVSLSAFFIYKIKCKK